MSPALLFIRLIHGIASDYFKKLVNLLKIKKLLIFIRFNNVNIRLTRIYMYIKSRFDVKINCYKFYSD